MLCWKGSSVRRKEKTALLPVYLNVYDLTPMNAYGYWLGLGVFHSGVEGQFLFLGFGCFYLNLLVVMVTDDKVWFFETRFAEIFLVGLKRN